MRSNGMAPLYDGHDYYKKMLELQDKLRRSEEERIRLEERFNLLLQESRNRHDACMNRLRIRYIEFLEEQRARDERNRKLLNALDRVDSSLSLMSAKTDRLNILRKQYEANLLRNYRPASSVTGDSGIASQNEKGYPGRNVAGIQTELPARRKVLSPSTISQNYQTRQNVARQIPYSKQITEPHHSTPLGTPYQGNLIEEVPQNHGDFRRNQEEVNSIPIRQDSVSQQPSAAHISNVTYPNYDVRSQRNLHTRPTVPLIQGNVQSDQRNYEKVDPRVQNWPENLASNFVRNTEISPRNNLQYEKLREKTMASELPSAGGPTRYEDVSISQMQMDDPNIANLTKLPQNNFRSDLPPTDVNFDPYSFSRRTPLSANLNYLSIYPRDNLKSESEITPQLCDAFGPSEMARRNFLSRLETPSQRILSKNFDLDEQERTTMLLENELDRYIGKIRNLHRDAEPQSQEEVDHEQNTSGDLLNVTLSDDGADLPPENKVKGEKMPNDVQKVLALADELASKTMDVSNNECPSKKGSTDDLEVENRPVEDDRKFSSVPTSEIIDEERPVSTVLVEDGISEDVMRYRTELDRPRPDIKRIAKPNEPRARETRGQKYQDDENVSDVLANRNDRDNVPDSGIRDAYSNGNFEDKYRLFSSEQMNLEEDEETFEDLEPWDIESVQRHIREIRLDDYEGHEPSQTTKGKLEAIVESARNSEESMNNIHLETSDRSGTEDNNVEHVKSQESSSEENQAENLSTKQDVEQINYDINSSVSDAGDSADKNKVQTGKEEGHYSEENGESLKDRNPDSSVDNLSLGQIPKESENPEAFTDNVNYDNGDHLNQDYQYENQEYGEQNLEQQYAEYGNAQYEQYVDDPNNYGQDPNAQYEQDTNAQYEQDPNAQYEQGPNAQYEQDPNAQYEQGPNAQYEQDPNAQYEQDPNAQYEQDPTAQYEQDPNAQYEQDPNAQYEQDPNAQYEHYPDSQYQQDPNAQYDQNQAQDYSYYDQQQYPGTEYNEADPNQQYSYTENIAYDNPDQIYDAQKQEYDQGQEYNVEESEHGVKDEEKNETVRASGGGEDLEVLEEKSALVQNQEEKEEVSATVEDANKPKKKKDVIKSLLDSDTESTIERNTSNTESDFDFN